MSDWQTDDEADVEAEPETLAQVAARMAKGPRDADISPDGDDVELDEFGLESDDADAADQGEAEVEPAATSFTGVASGRTPVSVIVPFAGDAREAAAALALLRSLDTVAGDQLILADNSGTAPSSADGIEVVQATGEGSPSRARNAGAAVARNAWLLFLDSDVRAPADLLERFFAERFDPRIGAITGDIVGVEQPMTLAARYGTMRNFLGQRSHVMNPYRPRASSANLLVRRMAFEQIGGYREGIRQAEDTDFCWRLQEAGWRLGFCEDAVVAHAYRESLSGLRAQWRGYAAGAAWLAREYPDFKLDPGINRMVRRVLKRVGIGPGVAFRADGRSSKAAAQISLKERVEFFGVDCLLGVEEKVGHRLSNELPGNRTGEPKA